jgi:hypothetical protein
VFGSRVEDGEDGILEEKELVESPKHEKLLSSNSQLKLPSICYVIHRACCGSCYHLPMSIFNLFEASTLSYEDEILQMSIVASIQLVVASMDEALV